MGCVSPWLSSSPMPPTLPAPAPGPRLVAVVPGLLGAGTEQMLVEGMDESLTPRHLVKGLRLR